MPNKFQKKAKIGILTLPLGHNYGGVIQAWALQRSLDKLNKFEIQILNYRGAKLSLVRYLKMILFGMIGKSEDIHTAKKYSKIRAFRNNHLKLSPNLWGKKALRNYIKSQSMDHVLIGSDQVWRQSYSKEPEVYFGALNIPKSVRLSTYAASFGGCTRVLNLEHCKSSLDLFENISVREKKSVDFIYKSTGIVASFVADPSLLIEADEYISLFNLKKDPKEHLFSYILDIDMNKENILKKVVLHIQDEVVELKNIDSKNNQTLNAGVVEWINNFYNASFVITDSYHGVLFSIIFKKDFVVIPNLERGVERFLSILKVLELEERLVQDVSEVKQVLLKSIDWESVEIRRKIFVDKSLIYLNSAF